MLTRESILKKIEEFIGKHCLCCDFPKHYYDDSILSLFIEFGEELLPERMSETYGETAASYQTRGFSSTQTQPALDEAHGFNLCLEKIRQKLAELGGK